MSASRSLGSRPSPWQRVLLIPSIAALLATLAPVPILASHTPDPTSVTIAGSLQSELGCAGDWDPSCAATQLGYDAGDDVWQGTFSVPAGSWEYKAALNGSWDENYGAKAQPGGANIGLNLGAAEDVKFYYDHESHWITDNVNAVIATVPGSFQSELGCAGDWDPACLRSWLQDPDGDGTYDFVTTALPAGDYEGKVAIDESWDENYGQGGTPGGANIAFTVPADNDEMTFSWDSASKILTITAPAPGDTVAVVGSLQDELGCPGDWQPECAASELTLDPSDGIWQGTFDLPAGDYEFKVALNDSWDVNYGRFAQQNGPNIPLSLAAPASVKFYFDPVSHWVTSNRNATIATVPGSFQSEIGCPGDWQPDCLRSWLQDPDEDGIYRFVTTSIPPGSYEAKVAIDESWDENYGQGGAPGGANIPFTVKGAGLTVTFTYNAATHVLTIDAGPQNRSPNDVEWDGVRHDSRDLLYRTPGGAVPAGTPVTIRLRTFHDDVTDVRVRFYSVDRAGQEIVPMTVAAGDVSCYQADLASETCDFWQVTLPPRISDDPDNLWYRFIVTDGTDTDYYADNTPALDGGLGAMSDEVVDNSFALMIHEPGFSAPAWAKGAVIYQIFPDRFRNGRSDNDPATGDVRYDDPVLALPWGTLPEGYCRNYSDANADTCPWRFDDTPPDWSPDKEGPRGRDYMGGDLKGVDQNLNHLAALGVTAIYFNPIFDAGSNHSYDTQDYTRIDPYFGTQKDWENLVKHADELGIRIIVDGVFNHLSSDSPFFDRYGHYPTVGACESTSSPYRDWFYFRTVPAGTGECVADDGTTAGATYDGWFGFDSIPVIDKTNPEVQEYFLTSSDSITRRWLEDGAAGWRMDVSGDPSFPAGYWETFRDVVKSTDPSALTISETWQKDSTLLRMLRGDRLDTTMNYRLRDAVIGFLAVGPFDSKGFADSGRIIAPSEAASRLASIREDYPDAAFYSLMNLLDSHDTERVRWTLTPGAETTAAKELDAANVAEGKRRQELASLLQYGFPGAATVYYGDEVGMTGDDDPDDRRTFPAPNQKGLIDSQLLAQYQRLGSLRKELAALRDGDFTVLLADDSAGTLAYGRATASSAAVVAVNRGSSPASLEIPVAGYIPDGVSFTVRHAVGGPAGGTATVSGGTLTVTLPALGGILLATGTVDLAPPAAPANLRVTGEGDGYVSLAWDAAGGAAGYNVYASPVTGGGFVKLNTAPLTGTTFTASDLPNATAVYFVVTAVDDVGNESAWSNEATGVPHLVIGWANLQWPPTLSHTISAINRTDNVYGQVWIDGSTSDPGPTPTLRAQLGFGPEGSNPATALGWSWVDAAFNVDAGNNDEFVASLLPDATGAFDYAYRYSTTGGRDWLYADLNGPVPSGALPPNPGKLTVTPSSDTTPPPTPTGLVVVSASPAGVELAWDAVSDPTFYAYEIRRSSAAGGPYTTVGMATSPSFTDLGVDQGATYYYVARSVDTSFNRSGDSAEVEATAELRTVTLTFNLTVPSGTDAAVIQAGAPVNIAGFLDRLDGNHPQWNPGGTPMTRVDATTWTITFTGKEFTPLEYKYALGSWDYVEKDAGCGEIANRQLTLSYGTTGTQTVNDTVLNWRNIAPCGN